MRAIELDQLAAYVAADLDTVTVCEILCRQGRAEVRVAFADMVEGGRPKRIRLAVGRLTPASAVGDGERAITSIGVDQEARMAARQPQDRRGLGDGKTLAGDGWMISSRPISRSLMVQSSGMTVTPKWRLTPPL